MQMYIFEMLRGQRKGHISFHTPGHKRAGADITELSYSDNLSSPSGVLAAAEKDIAEILGADKSFILTDGSTCGIFSMLYALRESGRIRVGVPEFSHPSVRHACEVLGLKMLKIPQNSEYGIPLQPCTEQLKEAIAEADALLLTSPDYYGFYAPLREAEKLCRDAGKPLLVDGAHGSHLHFTPMHAGKFADMWVDGVHKSLPALTQGAVVSAKGEWAERLQKAVKYFRTTSPSYPVMASVEYAVKFPRNKDIEVLAEAFKREQDCIKNDDWTKLLIPFGKYCDSVQSALEKSGIYPEFSDGNYLLFYLSPCTKAGELKRLSRILKKLPRDEIKKDAPCGQIPMYEGEER